MMIIGVDYHPGFQQIALLVTDYTTNRDLTNQVSHPSEKIQAVAFAPAAVGCCVFPQSMCDGVFRTENTVLSAEQGLRRLIEGNKRFVAGKAHFPTVCKETLAVLAKAQHPYATILGCADSRVPPELIFDANFGELFIVRVAGNVISPEVMGSIQYAGSHLHTPLFVVLGHEECGAVKAAIESKLNGAKHHSRIQILVNNIVPGLSGLDPHLSRQDQLAWAVEANVRWSMRQLLKTREGRQAAREGRKKLVGAVFEFNSGRVRFL